jgi:hypothetical protein
MSTGLSRQAHLDTTDLTCLVCNSELREGGKGKNCLEDLDGNERIILKLVLNKMEGF